MVEINDRSIIYEAYKDIFNQLGDKSKSLDEIRDLIAKLLLKNNE